METTVDKSAACRSADPGAGGRSRGGKVNVVVVLLVLVSVVPIWLAQRLSEGTVRGAGAGAVAAR